MTRDHEFRVHTTIVADTVAAIRRCDVYRLLDCWAYKEPDKVREFTGWLVRERPDLEREIEECLADLEAEAHYGH